MSMFQEIWSLFLLTLTFCVVSTKTEIPIHGNLGVQLTVQESPIFYDAVVPALVEFKLPQWNQSDILIHQPKCPNAEHIPNTLEGSCPSTYFILEIQNRFSKFILENRLQYASIINKNGEAEIATEELCGIVKPHFGPMKRALLSRHSYELYANHLQNCSPVDQLPISQITKYNYNLIEPFHNMSRKFKQEIWGKVPSEDRVDAGLWANFVTATNALIFTNLQMEINRWRMAFEDCSSGNMPRTLLTLEMQSDIKNHLQRALEHSPFEYKNINDVGQFSECFFIDDNYFVLRMLFPVALKHPKNLTLISLKTEEFLNNKNEICQVDLKGQTQVLKDHETGLIYSTTCNSRELCHIPTATSRKNIFDCISILFNTKTTLSDVMNYCSLTCTPLNPLNANDQPIVKKVATDSFLIVGGIPNSDSLQEILTKCPKMTDVFHRSVDIGTLQVTLPCSCRLNFSSVKFVPTSSCEAYPVMRRFIPLQWIDRKKFGSLELNQILKLEFNEVDIITEHEKENSTSELLLPVVSGIFSEQSFVILIVLLCTLSILFSVILAYHFRKLTLSYNLMKLGSQKASYKMTDPERVTFNARQYGCGGFERDSTETENVYDHISCQR